MTQQEKVMHNAFINNNVDFGEYTKLVQLEVWVVSALVEIEDMIQNKLNRAGLFSQNLKKDSKVILKKLEDRDASNFKIVNTKMVNVLSEDANFILEILMTTATKFDSKEDRLKVLSTIKNFK